MRFRRLVLGSILACFFSEATLASEPKEGMTAIQGPIAVSGMQSLKVPLVAAEQAGAGRWGSRPDRMETLRNGLFSPAERAAQIAKQRAVKVHTVYKVNGKIAAVHQRSGFTTTANGLAGARNISGQGDADAVGRARRLSGDALNDFVADQITANLREVHGSALEVETYENAATAPTSGEVHDQMFGINGRRGSL